jgi:uncharacterized protein YicC (UPF0701 family)
MATPDNNLSLNSKDTKAVKRYLTSPDEEGGNTKILDLNESLESMDNDIAVTKISCTCTVKEQFEDILKTIHDEISGIKHQN